MNKPTAKRRDMAQEITNRIIAALEKGDLPWRQPWENAMGGVRPIRNNGAPYTGVNVLILWDRAAEKGFENPRWMTFRQALELGGHVRKGEKSVSIVFYGATVKEIEESDRGPSGDETLEKTIRFLKSYPVFNIEQIDDLPSHFYAAMTPAADRTPPPSAREDFFARIGANVRHGGDRAFYHRTGDFIQMPPFAAFDDPEKYYAVLGHETVHWTGAGHRLDRAKGKTFGDRQYAYEELVAETGSAILGAAIGLRPDHIEDHAAYIGSWLKALKGDKRFIFRAAADAQRAVDFILERGGHAQGPALVAETPLADAA